MRRRTHLSPAPRQPPPHRRRAPPPPGRNRPPRTPHGWCPLLLGPARRQTRPPHLIPTHRRTTPKVSGCWPRPRPAVERQALPPSGRSHRPPVHRSRNRRTRRRPRTGISPRWRARCRTSSPARAAYGSSRLPGVAPAPGPRPHRPRPGHPRPRHPRPAAPRFHLRRRDRPGPRPPPLPRLTPQRHAPFRGASFLTARPAPIPSVPIPSVPIAPSPRTAPPRIRSPRIAPPRTAPSSSPAPCPPPLRAAPPRNEPQRPAPPTGPVHLRRWSLAWRGETCSAATPGPTPRSTPGSRSRFCRPGAPPPRTSDVDALRRAGARLSVSMIDEDSEVTRAAVATIRT